MAHTKGEWTWTIRTGGKFTGPEISIHQKGHDPENDLDEDNGLTSIAGIWVADEESKANAQLISAAPKMLEALENIIDYGARPEEIAEAEQAIKKAKGE